MSGAASSRHVPGWTAVRLGVSSLSNTILPKGQEKMSSESTETDTNSPPRSRNNTSTLRQNQRMLDLRQQVELQEHIIRYLLSEKDSLTKELDSRLFLVEAQLRHEQKHIEEVLNKKEQLIQFQDMQIKSLKQLLTQTTNSYRSSRKRLVPKRYSVALDEYMKDHCVVSRAFPVIVQAENEKQHDNHRICSRTRSLPELRLKEIESQRQSSCCNFYQHTNNYRGLHQPSNRFCTGNPDKRCKECSLILTQELLDEMANHKWSSDCDSEHSDSLDSGISSPSIQTRSMHDYFEPSMLKNRFAGSQTGLNTSISNKVDSNFNKNLSKQQQNPENFFLEDNCHKPRRSSSIGSFIQKTFSSSDKTTNAMDNRCHSQFSSLERQNHLTTNDHPTQKDRFISSANRTFGTNHRSVMKPRDVKFKKLFKFKRRTEEPEVPSGADYMTV